MNVQKFYNKFDRFYNPYKPVLKYKQIEKALELKSKKNILIPIEKFVCKFISSIYLDRKTIDEFEQWILNDHITVEYDLKTYLINYFNFYKFSNDQTI